MSDSPMNRYLRNLLILFFACAVVFLGASEIQKKHKRYLAKKGSSATDGKEMVRELKGTDIRASISRKAVKEMSGNSDSSKGTKETIAKMKKEDAEESDQLDKEDREQLNNLIGKISR